MALYEVMSKAREKPGYRRTLDKMHEKHSSDSKVEETDEGMIKEAEAEHKPEVAVEPVAEPIKEQTVECVPIKDDSGDAIPQTGVQWWRKPRVVQMNAGRIEFSMPYQLVIALVLGLVLVVLVAFQLGQRYYMAATRAEPTNPAGNPIEQGVEAEPNPLVSGDDSNVRARYELNQDETTPVKTNNDQAQNQTTKPKPTVPTVSVGDHTIILVEHDKKPDLENVQKHFKKYGISTDIVGRPGRYFLQTTQRFKVPSAACSETLTKIKEVGVKYKDEAPEGSKTTFAPRYFSDAYPMKVKE